jgi:hypothetical protein
LTCATSYTASYGPSHGRDCAFCAIPYSPNSANAQAWLPGAEQQQLWNLLDAARRLSARVS